MSATLLQQSRLWIGPGLLLCCSLTQAQPGFTASEIPLGEWPDEVLLEDMDGNGRLDLILPQWSAGAGRELLIHLQQEDGSFLPEASRHVEIKPEIIAFGLADLRPEPGVELLLFSARTVFSLSSAIPTYSGNLKPLFDWELVASVPDRRRVLHFPDLHDMDGDGHIDLLLPGRERYGYFKGAADESFTPVQQFNTVNEELDPSELPLGSARLNTNIAINEREGIVLSVTSRSTTAFEDFASDWSTDEQTALLDTELWVPSAVSTHMNADENADIVFMNIGNDLYGQVNVLLQNSNGHYADTPDWRGPIDTRGNIRLLDVNGDDMSDLLRIIDNSNEWDVHFFLNRDGQFMLDQPDQIMKFSGYDLTLSVTDLNNDGNLQLSVSYYTIPVVDALRNASIIRSQLLYGSSTVSGEIFHSRPDFKLDETFSAETIRGLSSQINLETDLDNDGRRDALYLSTEGTLAAKAISPELQFSDSPFWQYVPARTILRFEVEDMNEDSTADLVLFHSTAITILTSAQNSRP